MKWQAAVLEIREKINSAIQDMPPVEEITQLLSGACEFLITTCSYLCHGLYIDSHIICRSGTVDTGTDRG